MKAKPVAPAETFLQPLLAKIIKDLQHSSAPVRYQKHGDFGDLVLNFDSWPAFETELLSIFEAAHPTVWLNDKDEAALRRRERGKK